MTRNQMIFIALLSSVGMATSVIATALVLSQLLNNQGGLRSCTKVIPELRGEQQTTSADTDCQLSLQGAEVVDGSVSAAYPVNANWISVSTASDAKQPIQLIMSPIPFSAVLVAGSASMRKRFLLQTFHASSAPPIATLTAKFSMRGMHVTFRDELQEPAYFRVKREDPHSHPVVSNVLGTLWSKATVYALLLGVLMTLATYNVVWGRALHVTYPVLSLGIALFGVARFLLKSNYAGLELVLDAYGRELALFFTMTLETGLLVALAVFTLGARESSGRVRNVNVTIFALLLVSHLPLPLLDSPIWMHRHMVLLSVVLPTWLACNLLRNLLSVLRTPRPTIYQIVLHASLLLIGVLLTGSSLTHGQYLDVAWLGDNFLHLGLQIGLAALTSVTLYARARQIRGETLALEKQLTLERNASLLTLEKAVLQRTEQLLKQKLDAQHQAANIRKIMCIVAHDIRGPLSSLSLMLKNMTRTQGGTALDGIWMAASTLDTLIREVDFVVRQNQCLSGRIYPIRRQTNISKLVDGLLTVFLGKANNACITILSEVSPSLHVLTDAQLLTIALSNLIDNALKYCPVGSVVRIRCAATCKIEVLDNGPGTSAQSLRHKLTPYENGPRDDHLGFGIGLSTTQEVCSLQGDALEIKSIPGQGTHGSIHMRAQALRVLGFGLSIETWDLLSQNAQYTVPKVDILTIPSLFDIEGFLATLDHSIIDLVVVSGTQRSAFDLMRCVDDFRREPVRRPIPFIVIHAECDDDVVLDMLEHGVYAVHRMGESLDTLLQSLQCAGLITSRTEEYLQNSPAIAVDTATNFQPRSA